MLKDVIAAFGERKKYMFKFRIFRPLEAFVWKQNSGFSYPSSAILLTNTEFSFLRFPWWFSLSNRPWYGLIYWEWLIFPLKSNKAKPYMWDSSSCWICHLASSAYTGTNKYVFEDLPHGKGRWDLSCVAVEDRSRILVKFAKRETLALVRKNFPKVWAK